MRNTPPLAQRRRARSQLERPLLARRRVCAALCEPCTMDGSVVATLAGMGLGLVFCTATCIICRIWRRNRYYKKVQHSLDEEERAFQECTCNGTPTQPES